MSDESRELVQRAAGGDAKARDRLLEQHLAGLHAFVRLRLGPMIRAKESSSDIVHSVCREVLQDLPRFEYKHEAGFRHWLFRQAERKIVDRGRFWKREKRDVAREAKGHARHKGSRDEADILECYQTFLTPSRDAVAKEELARVERAFGELSEDYREVISLSRIVGLSHAEIAHEMERSEGAVRTLLSRALARLATLLTK